MWHSHVLGYHVSKCSYTNLDMGCVYCFSINNSILKFRCSKGGGSPYVQISGEVGVVHRRLLAIENSSSGLSRGVVSVILRLAILIKCRRVPHTHTDTHTHGHTDKHAIMAINHASLAPRELKTWYLHFITSMQAVFLRRVLIITRWYWRCYRT